MSAILKFHFLKREQLRFSGVNDLNYTKRPNFACGKYIFPKTRGNKNKPWTHSTPLKGTNGRQKTYEIFHVYRIFSSGFMCQTTVIFGITKDGSLVLNTLASWNCFTCKNLFKNGANDMSECLTCETAFCKKAQNSVQFGSSDFDQISPACGKHSY